MNRGVIVLLLLAGCAREKPAASGSTTVGIASRTIADDPSSIIDADRGTVMGLRVAMPADTVKGILGAPLREGTELVDSIAITVLEYPMGSLRLQATTGLFDFLCGGDQCATAEGVGIGDSSDVIYGTYGPTPPRGPMEAPEALDYRLGTDPCNLTFTLSMGRITSIELSCVR